jgi:hypothetical protein
MILYDFITKQLSIIIFLHLLFSTDHFYGALGFIVLLFLFSLIYTNSLIIN